MIVNKTFFIYSVLILSAIFLTSCRVKTEENTFGYGNCNTYVNAGKTVFSNSICNGFDNNPDCKEAPDDFSVNSPIMGCYLYGGPAVSDKRCITCQFPRNNAYKVSASVNDIISNDSETVDTKPLYYFNGENLESLIPGSGKSVLTGDIGAENFGNWYEKILSTSASGNHSSSISGSRTIYPLEDSKSKLTEGAFSCWFLINTPGSINGQYSSACISLFTNENNFQIKIFSVNGSDMIMNIYLLGNLILSQNIGPLSGWNHLYVVWGNNIKDDSDFLIFSGNKQIYTLDNDTLSGLLAIDAFSFSLSGDVVARGDRVCKTKYHIIKKCKNVEYNNYAIAGIDEVKIWDTAYSLDPQSAY